MLKKTLSLLLSKFYSKKESELVGHQAMPSTTSITLTPTTTSITDWGSVCQGVAPTDGYAAIRFTANSSFCIASAQAPQVNVFTTPQNTGDILMAACPVAKGQHFVLCARNAKNIVCWFVKNIGAMGGGKVLILCGGVLCRLKHLSSSLRRSSLLIRKDKSLHSLRLQLIGVSKFPQVGMEQINGPTPLQLLLTVGSELKGFAQALSIWMSVLTKTTFAKVVIETPVLSRAYAECPRERRLTTFSRPVALLLRERFCSFQLTAPQLNVVNGGASC